MLAGQLALRLSLIMAYPALSFLWFTSIIECLVSSQIRNSLTAVCKASDFILIHLIELLKPMIEPPVSRFSYLYMAES